MECPVCGCHVDVSDRDDVVIVTCVCCDTAWLALHDELERILVGPED